MTVARQDSCKQRACFLLLDDMDFICQYKLGLSGGFFKVRKKKVCRCSCLCVCELPVSVLTFAGASVRLQLHEVRAGTGEGLVEVDETEVGARASTITRGTWVRS